ncbi:signal recognition particle-docking protein FtsY [Candidatus Planktophila versatilis]|uniref:Fused signal recognition particle receptor n=1 Tax=Candidatus Planktophila versatilis TaxID=1884905 RepID=A0ABM6MF35_9ACTN|nr:signal recognition particle-docking protein FtsY [Candidatus Planktophila versatilis]ASY17398.1 fused signal recognition particle receptor [Candidatus Planktophila versatilis]
MGLFNRLVAKVRGTSTASALDWSEIETELLSSDLGPSLVTELLAAAKKMRGDDAEAAIKEILRGKFSEKSRALADGDGLQIIVIVGVNGTGKTTSVAKLATHLHSQGKSILLGAADTFRAAAVEQLTTWGQRIGIETISGKEGAEPASVAFDSAKRALEVGADFLLIDTAGRLHNKSALMDELGKVKRVVGKVAPISEVLLVIDATTGQNGLTQAKVFSEAVDVTGLILTKLDGSARGGVALAIESALDLPIKFIGTGEGATDFTPFDPEKYLEGLLA